MDSKIMIRREKIRAILKKTEHKLISENTMSHLLAVDEKRASEIFIYLQEQGYIELSDAEGLWTLSLTGRMLIYKPMHRMYKASTIAKHLKELIERAEEVNNSSYFAHYVICIKMSTPFPLPERSKAVMLGYAVSRKKISDKEYEKRLKKQRWASTTLLDSTIDYYPYEAIRAFLQSGVHAFKLTEYVFNDPSILQGDILWEYDPEREVQCVLTTT